MNENQAQTNNNTESNENTQEVKRNHPGKLGKGTPGSRLKARWRAQSDNVSLKKFVRDIRNGKRETQIESLKVDAEAWFDSKRYQSLSSEKIERRGVRSFAPVVSANKSLNSSSKKKSR